MISTRRQSGFTLVELLAAVTVLGLLLGVSFGSVRIAERSWLRGAEVADRSHHVRRSAEFLRRQLASLIPMSYPDDSASSIAFEGGRKEVRFVAPAPDAAGHLGLVTLTVAVEERDTSSEIWLEMVPLDPGSERWSRERPIRRVRLFDSLEQAEFAYLGAPGPDDEVDWHSEWPGDALRYPHSVHLRSTGAQTETLWSDLHFRIHAERWR